MLPAYVLNQEVRIMNSYLNDISDEILEDIVYEYEEELDEVDVDEIIMNLKNNISDYIFDEPEDFFAEEPKEDFDFDFEDDDEMPVEWIEKLEPEDEIFFVDK